MRDEIVEDVRKLREERSARFNFDIDAIFDDLKKLERERDWTVVSLEPKQSTNVGAASTPEGAR